MDTFIHLYELNNLIYNKPNLIKYIDDNLINIIKELIEFENYPKINISHSTDLNIIRSNTPPLSSSLTSSNANISTSKNILMPHSIKKLNDDSSDFSYSSGDTFDILQFDDDLQFDLEIDDINIQYITEIILCHLNNNFKLPNSKGVKNTYDLIIKSLSKYESDNLLKISYMYYFDKNLFDSYIKLYNLDELFRSINSFISVSSSNLSINEYLKSFNYDFRNYKYINDFLKDMEKPFDYYL